MARPEGDTPLVEILFAFIQVAIEHRAPLYKDLL